MNAVETPLDLSSPEAAAKSILREIGVPLIAGQLSPEAIADLKAKHGELHIIEVTISATDTGVAYLKPADRNVVAYGLTKSMKSQIVEAGEFVLKNCYVGGDERLKLTGPVAENKAQLTAAIAAASLLDMFDVSVKNA
ncbi:hypothetical protein [Hymenobacter negativus]|uniref:Uncharacterized protein n=1 Tax=Hymenobacter negativus TaxID=2795026 RepID=A0ABS3QD47_9BACT|nr:hypothetical protein [Hymenobacter negativus]MBO2009170.1 hypothetical protein [Hymenobacter negativus]